MKLPTLVPALVLLSVLLPMPNAAADCLVNTPDSRCTTPGYPPGDCTVNAVDSDCRERASCMVNVLSASCFGTGGTCTVNANGGRCQGDCTVNVNLGVCDDPSADCPINTGYCLSTASCLVNAGYCDNAASCLVNLGWCGGGGECAVNVASPLAPAAEPDCWGTCTVNYGDGCRATRCDDALVSLRQDILVDDLVLCL